ncbi:MAG: anthranilate synthase component I, partial [Proteobacteria bacterium]|nr:anthranilate synthase component I [Pseudomonadota bacterium]
VEQFTGGASRLDDLIGLLDRRRGVVLSSGTTVPGRYESFDLGFSDPPLVLETARTDFSLIALNARGEVLIAFLGDALREPCVAISERSPTRLAGHIVRGAAPVEEDQRTRRASVMSLVRDLVAVFGSSDDPMLGLFGAFAYDLVFQIEDLVQKRARERDQRDIVLYVPDRLLAYDRATGRGVVLSYEFGWNGKSTEGMPRETSESLYARSGRQGFADHGPGEYQATVETARAAFARGDLFEAVPGQLFAEPCERTPAEVFQRLCRINPSPYGALMNLGDGEFLVSASPEMFVRCDGRRVETCPISGTIARGADAIGDAEQIRQLLNSEKDEFELNMCTDVDRNDKARVCLPGSIKVLARRQIETYSKLFHTVDHVEGVLRPGFDSLDAFLTHAWAVTVTGAPKLWAMQFVEDHERSPRRWYAGAIGAVNFDGSINTGLTIRTIRMKDGLAEVRVGATCLFDSDPAAEDRECQVKAAALFQALRGDPPKPLSAVAPDATGSGKRVLLIDHDDSFVHMLADYFRQVGAAVTVVRYVHAQQMLNTGQYDLLVLSPGPGRPQDFAMAETISTALGKKLPIFGVCLGVQAIGEYFGGQLGQLSQPAHGRPSRVQVRGGCLMRNLPNEIVIGRYHSLYVERNSMPDVLAVTASTEDGVAMAIEHKTLAVGGVQFHPESLMSLGDAVGLRIVENAFRLGAPVN